MPRWEYFRKLFSRGFGAARIHEYGIAFAGRGCLPLYNEPESVNARLVIANIGNMGTFSLKKIQHFSKFTTIYEKDVWNERDI